MDDLRAFGNHQAGWASTVLLATLVLGAGAALAQDEPQWTAERIMAEQLRRNALFPYVYEEQTMVLTDEAGNREVRQCRRFSRVEPDATVKFLLVFDAPKEIRGVALLAVREPGGNTRGGVYLPAFGTALKRPAGDELGGHFLGTDFTVEDLTTEVRDDYRYESGADRVLDDVPYFVVEAYPRNESARRATARGFRRHLIRKDNFVIVQTDFFDRRARLVKRITRHDLKRVHARSWRANMLVANDLREHHRTLLKIDRRVYSRDYVPAELFEPDYLLANRHVEGAAMGEEEPGEPTAGSVRTPSIDGS